PVSAQQTVGQVGYTTCGSSTTDVTKTHLHFELKNFSTLCAGGNDNGICAYTSPLPDQYGWFNPLDSLHPVANFATALPVSVNSNSQVPLLVGPGAFANTVYRTVLQANPSDKFDVVRSAAPTASPACSSAWYEVAKLDGSMFLDP